VDLKPGTPLNDFILTVIANNTLTARELFTLCSLIRNRIKQALELSLITEDMLTQLCHPLFIIKTVFIDTNWQSKLINGDLSLLALDVQRSKDLCSASKIGRFSFFANVSSINSVSHEYTRLLQIA
jgi:hypothetical protein